MKKNKQAKNNIVKDCNKVTNNANGSNSSNKSKASNNNDLGFKDETRSFELDEENDHSFELK